MDARVKPAHDRKRNTGSLRLGLAALFPERVGERVVLGETPLIAGFAQQGGRHADEWAVDLDRLRQVGGDPDILRQQAERETGSELTRNEMLLCHMLGIEALAG